MSFTPYISAPRLAPLCATCADGGQVIERRSTGLYACGYTTVAVPCPACKAGFDLKEALGVDGKLLAAGGAA